MEDVMEINLDDLEAKCRAATPGPWFVLYGDDECFQCSTAIASEKTREGNDGLFNDDEHLVAVTYRQRYPFVAMDDDDCGEANSAYIAAANPAVTLALIAQLRAAREFLPVLKGLVADIQGLMSESEGVAGLHRNGDVAPWDELEPGGRFERLSSLSAAIDVIGKAEA